MREDDREVIAIRHRPLLSCGLQRRSVPRRTLLRANLANDECATRGIDLGAGPQLPDWRLRDRPQGPAQTPSYTSRVPMQDARPGRDRVAWIPQETQQSRKLS